MQPAGNAVHKLAAPPRQPALAGSPIDPPTCWSCRCVRPKWNADVAKPENCFMIELR